MSRLFTSSGRLLSCVLLFATPWTVACQAPLSMGFSRQEYGSGLQYSSPGDLPDPGTEPVSSVSVAMQDESLLLELSGEAGRDVLSFQCCLPGFY